MDMPYLRFLAGAMLISLSGVMAPGPLSAVIIGKGAESPHAGAYVAFGHGLVEFPLMAALYFGLGFIFELSYVKESIGIAGGIVLLVMAAAMFRNIRNPITVARERRSPLMAGVALSAANPYFFIWWATVGAAMAIQAAGFGPAGFVIFMFMHWSCDLTWSWFLSAASFRGGRFFGRNFQKAVFAISGILLAGFSVKFIYDALMSFY